ncbi:glutamate/aspartate periplasmic-binding protein precursor [mine drainage metagenome]|uniref:Glutamate/aspartate periplasmic-binding protein n=1 Tax=mine drainage metagenome TaxID=410659 RepID=A0A1J5QC94_9ZZZZ
MDKTIDGVMKSGDINAIYAKWFTSAIPPKGINLNFPQNAATKEAFAHPNDKGVE